MKQQKGFRPKIALYFDSATGWIAAALIGTLTAVVAFVVDIAVATVSDWKLGYCTENWLMNIESCCTGKTPLVSSQLQTLGETCPEFHVWTSSYASSYAIYVALALGFGLLSGAATMTTRASLPRTTSDETAQITGDGKAKYPVAGKTMYMAAGSGIPELKTILSGFVIPHFLGLKVLAVKAFGAIFAVATGMCLGKEGPFVHISACVGHLVASRFGKYRENSRKMRGKLMTPLHRSSVLLIRNRNTICCVRSGSQRCIRRASGGCSVHLRGDKHLLPKESPLASVPLLTLRLCDPQSTEPNWYWKAGAI